MFWNIVRTLLRTWTKQIPRAISFFFFLGGGGGDTEGVAFCIHSQIHRKQKATQVTCARPSEQWSNNSEELWIAHVNSVEMNVNEILITISQSSILITEITENYYFAIQHSHYRNHYFAIQHSHYRNHLQKYYRFNFKNYWKNTLTTREHGLGELQDQATS